MAGRRIGRERLHIGLLGGSFNPAHAGHRHISLAALKFCGLDQLWWLVSPQNPLKSPHDYLPLIERVAQARQVAHHPKIAIMDIEKQLPSHYTVYTLKILKKRFPFCRFVWIMGADNLRQFPLWHRWREIARLVPIVICDRDNHSYRALAGKMASVYKQYRVQGRELYSISNYKPPAWGYIRMRKHPLSASFLRNQSRFLQEAGTQK